jgi:hypothetical protein
MTDRKFTPPTEFPAEYVDGRGNKVVILGRSNHKGYPLIGFDHTGTALAWSEYGTVFRDLSSIADLHDKPKRIATWHNVYTDWISPGVKYRSGDSLHRLCVYRIERDEDGGNPEIFVEEV